MQEDLFTRGRSSAEPSNAESATARDTPEPGPFTPPSINLPKGGGAIHGMGEKFAANPVTGTGSLTVPIATSPGRGGFGPQLTIAYDSGAGNGPFGLGWHLALPAITRKTDKGLPRYQDGEESDVFVLSDVEDLVPVLIEEGGEWRRDKFRRRADAASYHVQRYRPRIEGLFARIERWTNTETGETHWRSITRDNVTTFYGKTAESRIADPADESRVFSWLICESYDDKGNALTYEYVPEDSAGIDLSQAHERNRTELSRSANRYLKRIKYGNLPSRLVEPDLAQMRWLFEVVFDYGEGHYRESAGHELAEEDEGHEFVQAARESSRPWPVRQDPFSSYRAGFEVRTYRLCRRVLMFHHFVDELAAEDVLVRSTEFTYSEGPIASFISSVTQSGYVQRESGNYLRKSLPPLAFTYTQVEIDETVYEVDADSLENLPAGLDPSAYQWVDLDGEGISGILTEQGNAWFYKRNLSPVAADRETTPNGAAARFAAAELVAQLPSARNAEGGQPHFLDLAGDGQLDLVAFRGAVAGFYERSHDERWEKFTAFDSLPNVPWDDRNLRFVDLTGDGHADVLLTEDDALTWYLSLAETGFAEGERVQQALDEETGPRLVFNDPTQSVYLADLSGDGLSDLVRIRNGEVCYWPNLGYGRFGPKVTMDNAPWFDSPGLFDQQGIRLADIDGSGVTDIIYLGSDGVHLYFNEAGNGWSAARMLEQFPLTDDLAAVAAIDLLGNGTACLVWSSPLPGHTGPTIRYMDLMAGQKPHLMVAMTNNLGAETRIQYAPSTKFYLADKLAGKPWITRLPFPVHVVERVETYDHISRNRFTSRYAYHHGYFDGVEREFRGFGLVEQWDTEAFATFSDSDAFPDVANLDKASHVPPVLTRTWFHTGAYRERERISRQFEDEYYREPELTDEAFRAMLLPDTPLSPDLTVVEEREAARALKGRMLRQEVYALDDTPQAAHPYSVSEHSYRLKLLQPRGETAHAVFYTCPCNTLNYHYERNPEDPRVSHEMSLEVDEFGNVLKAVAIGYGRRPGHSPLQGEDRTRQERLLMTYTETDVTNVVDEPDAYRTPLPYDVRTYELTGYDLPAGAPRFQIEPFVGDDFALVAGAEAIGYESLPNDGRTQKRLIERMRTLYRSSDLSGSLPLGQVDSMALPFEQYTLAFTSGLLQLYAGKIAESDLRTVLAEEARYVDLDGDGQWWIPSGQLFYAPEADESFAQELDFARRHFFAPHRYQDPFAQTVTVLYDDYDLLVARTIDPLGNVVNAEHDYRTLQPRQITDPNGNRSAIVFDALGLVAGSAVMGKADEGQGDSLDGFEPTLTAKDIRRFLVDPAAVAAELLQEATTRIIYDLQRFAHCGQPVYAATLARETHVSDMEPGQESKIQISFTYSDGFDREMQTKIQAEPGLAPEREANGAEPAIPGELKVDRETGDPVLATTDSRWVGTGRTVYNNKGKPVKQYEPFFSATHLYESEPEMVLSGVTPVLFYDPLERVVATLHPNHTYEKTVFDPWQQTTWDVNDTVLQTDPQNDPDVGGYFRRLPQEDYLPTWYARRADGELGASEQAAAEKAAAHAQTASVAHTDALGRSFLTIADNGLDKNGRPQLHATRVDVDIEGQPLAISDALDRVVLEYRLEQSGPDDSQRLLPGYDVAGNQLYQKSMEAGARWQLPDVGGKQIRMWNDRNFQQRLTYDELQRPVELFVSEGGGPEFLAEKNEYGERKPNAEQSNHRGQIWRVYDGAGVVTSEAFDFKGNLLQGRRQLLRDYRNVVDWLGDQALEEEAFTSQTSYDALNRPLTATTPDKSVLHPTYNEANLLEQVEVNLRGADEGTVFVANFDYNAKGQRERIEYGNSVVTDYEYDEDMFRLTRLYTRRGDDVLQDLRYAYDPVGNITSIHDEAQQTIYFDNQAVESHAEYTYDAIYRLVHATGREHVGQTGQAEAHTRWKDSGRTQLAHPHDGQAMRRYVERYDYDEVGNILRLLHRAASGNWTRHYEYGEPSLLEPEVMSNRLSGTSVGEARERYPYDAHGSMTAMPHLAHMQWNHQDQLQRVDLGGGGTAHYVYDASGQRARKVIERQNGARKQERLYLSGFEVYREYDGKGEGVKLERETLHLMDNTRRIALVETRTLGEDESPEQLTRYQLGNHLDSACLELDAEAQIISYEEYTPYGITSYQAVRGQTEAPKRYRFTGKEREEESGLYYHGARYYTPWLGRWTSADPAGLVDGSNLYPYVANNPIRLIDPTGQQYDPAWEYEMWKPFTRLYGAAVESIWGGEADPDVSNEIRPPEGGVGGVIGGVLETITLRQTGVLEDYPSEFSRAGMDFGASQVPVLGPGENLYFNETVSGGPIDPETEAFFLLVDVASLGLGALETRAASMEARLASAEARLARTELRLAETGGRVRTPRSPDPSTPPIQRGRAAEVDPSEYSGPWVDEASNVRRGGAITQCAPGSCVSASGQMLSGGRVSEAELLDQLGEWSNTSALREALNERAGATLYRGGGFVSGEDAVFVASRGPLAAELRVPGQPGHMVLIQPVGQGRFIVRDPLPGVSYGVDESWIRQFVAGGVWRP